MNGTDTDVLSHRGRASRQRIQIAVSHAVPVMLRSHATAAEAVEEAHSGILAPGERADAEHLAAEVAARAREKIAAEGGR